VIKLVTDASILSAFFLNEQEGQRVQQLIESDAIFYAPSFWRYEVSNVVWKRKEIPDDIAKGLIEDVWGFTVYEELPSKWVKDAFYISRRHNISFYDSSYIAMAQVFNMALLTLDKLQAKIATKVGVPLWRN